MSETFNFAGFTYPRHVPMFSPRKPVGKRLSTAYQTAARPITRSSPADSWGFYLDSDFAPGLRWSYADEVTSLRHNGWFYDDFGDSIRGIVMALPHGMGWLAGWTMGKGMASCVHCSIYDDEEEAARAADDAARYAADEQRDYEQAEDERIAAEEAEQQEQDAMPNFTASVRHVDTCLSCYVTDWCNGESETLLGVDVNGDTTYAEVRDGLLDALHTANLWERVSQGESDALYAAIGSEIADQFSTVKDMAAPFDASLDVASRDDEDGHGESCCAWFRISWERSE